MAKKKVNIEIPRSGAAADVPSGDVNIVYNNVRIAGLSETVDATLKTGGTVVQHDIEVEYVKPEAETVTIPVYSKPYGATTQTSIGNISGTVGEAVNLSYYVGEGTYSGASIFWGNSTGFEEQTVYGYAVINREGVLIIKLYVPNTEAIPSSCDRIIVRLYEG